MCEITLAHTEAFQQSRRERKKVEMRFAHMKRILKLDRLRLRGLSSVRDEVLSHSYRTEPSTSRQARLPCPTHGRTLRGLGVASEPVSRWQHRHHSQTGEESR
jgi:hypothetical protein